MEREYTVKQLARLSGVTVRTLHWYDEIGLLRPARVTDAGYRLYGPTEVDRLQGILFYRALGVPLKDIAALMRAPSFDRLAALEGHRRALLQQRAHLDALLATLDKTIATQKGEGTMTDSEKFAGFKQKLVEENEKAYGDEVRKAYGDEAADAANRKVLALSEQQYGAMQALEGEIKAALEAAVAAGESPEGPEGARIAALHRDWLGYTWAKYSPEAHKGLGQMYVADERFTAYYDAAMPGCAQWLCEAIQAHV